MCFGKYMPNFRKKTAANNWQPLLYVKREIIYLDNVSIDFPDASRIGLTDRGSPTPFFNHN